MTDDRPGTLSKDAMGGQRSRALLAFAVETLEARQLLSAAIHHAAKPKPKVHHPAPVVHHKPHKPKKPHKTTTSTATSSQTTQQTIHHVTPIVSLADGVSTAASPSSFSPAQLRRAYGVDSLAFNGIPADGRGMTIAIVVSGNAPTIQSDLTSFDNLYGLPAGNLTVLNQTGGTSLPPNDADWAVEASLDVEWSHAFAPAANIVLFEANTSNDSDIYAAVDTARHYAGVSVVSMSFTEDENSGSLAYDSTFTTPSGHIPVTFLAASGDWGGYSSASTSGNHPVIVGYPAASSHVVGVGGTSLTTDSTGNYSSETAWGHGTNSWYQYGSGGGVSTLVSQPSYQTGNVVGSTTNRTVPDISIASAPGAAIIDSFSYGSSPITVLGTSLSTPLWAGLITLTNQGRALTGLGTLDGSTQTLPALYSLPSSDFTDILSGSNGPYSAGTGYDLVTGRGSPITSTLIPDLVGAGTPTVGSFTVPASTVASGGYVTLTAGSLSDASGSGTVSGVNFYRETNGTAGYQSTDQLIGTGTKVGSTFQLAASTAGLAPGTYTFYARPTDGVKTGSASSITITVNGGGYSNWSTLSGIINNVPVSAGPIASVNIISGGNTIYGGPLDVTNTLNRIRSNSGAITASDGQPYANSGNLLPAGTWNEFNVDPQTGSSQGFSSSQVPQPGPMHLFIDTSGNVYFTGDSYASAVLVYSAPTNVPSIGSFSLSPSSLLTGASTTITASNVTETNGTVANVQFYRDTNGIPGLQIGSDTLMGYPTQSGNTWTLATNTANYYAGQYTYYAVATDANGNASAISSTTLTVNPLTPVIGTFSANPSAIVRNGTVTFTATGVTEVGGTIGSVQVYLETNGTSGYQPTDTLLGSGTQSGTTWTLANVSTSSIAPGTYTVYAVVNDTLGGSTNLSTTLTIQAPTPTIAAFSASPSTIVMGGATTLTASGVTENGGSVSSVSFYEDTNGVDGLQIGSDTLLGTGTQNGTTWTLPFNAAGLSAGPYKFFAVATDASNSSSSASVVTLTISGNGTPTVGSLTLGPSSVSSGTPVTLTASNVSETGGGTISSVSFYRESNGISGFQPTDTFVGSGTQSGNTWTLINSATTGLNAGAYTYYAVATDGASITSSAAGATLTVTPSTSAPIVAFDSSSFSANESDGTATITVDRTGDTTGASNVLYTTSDGTATAGVDYAATTGTLTFAAGQTSQTFTIPLYNIAAPAGTRSVNLALYNPANPTQTGVAASAVLNLTDNVAPVLAFHAIDTSANATDGTATITVDRTGNATQAATVHYSTMDGSATAGVDYVATSGTLSFAANQTSATITVTLLEPVAATAGNRSLTLTLDSPSTNAMLGAQYSTTLSIAHPAAPAWIDPNSAATWDQASHTLTVIGTTTILSDPGTDAPIIVANGSAAKITIPGTDTSAAYHLGGITLTNGASFTVGSVGAARSTTGDHVLVIGSPNPSSQYPFSLDSTSTLDLADNDMIVMHPGGSSPMSTILGEIKSASDNWSWDLPGITSSTAAQQGSAYRLGIAESGTLGWSSFDGQTLGSNAVIVRYTLAGDANLDGKVGLDDYTTVVQNLGRANTSWINGGFSYGSTVGLADYTQVVLNLGRSI